MSDRLVQSSVVASGPQIGQAPTNWLTQGTGDYNNDGKSDILWRGPNGEVAVWHLDGGALLSGPQLGVLPTNWAIQEAKAD